jgi:hypothetical protein
VDESLDKQYNKNILLTPSSKNDDAELAQDGGHSDQEQM